MSSATYLQEFDENIALGSNLVIMGLSTRLDQLQDNLNPSMTETLETDIPPLVASTQADPSSRQLSDVFPATNIQEIQRHLAANLIDSPSRRQPNSPASTNPFSMIQMQLLVPTPANESSERNQIDSPSRRQPDPPAFQL